MLSCSIWFSAPSFWMGGGLESRCVGRVCGAVRCGCCRGTGCSSYERRIYVAAVSQRLRNTGLDSLQKSRIFCPCGNREPRFLYCLVPSVITVSTELFRLLCVLVSKTGVAYTYFVFSICKTDWLDERCDL